MSIHQLLNITRPLFVIDTETTGVDPKSARIVELGFQRWTSEGMTLEWRSLVNPLGPISKEVTEVHGIDASVFEKCRTCGDPLAGHRTAPDLTDLCYEPTAWPTFKQLALNIAGGFQNCDFAGKNVRFDLKILAAEMNRVKVEWSYSNARIIDAERLEQLAVPRTLSDLHRKYTGLPHDGAHGALSDVRASVTVLVSQLNTYPNLPRDLDALHAEQWPGWLCDTGEFRMVNGVATCQFGKWRGVPMKNVEPSYWDWMLRGDFPADVRALASAAKLGKFPEGK